ncbi:uncharacterized protein RSE6_03486 [Rhynchosporium secalis]|uniref:Uncharacterized protein n=1 Tax=Rhynchosporium secalis TaxID=38038 RepID=A0A1E1M2W2_RHYSE|nr:uncharacterized protein RSE6_03486 [Rhynchosporium secalis]
MSKFDAPTGAPPPAQAPSTNTLSSTVPTLVSSPPPQHTCLPNNRTSRNNHLTKANILPQGYPPQGQYPNQDPYAQQGGPQPWGQQQQQGGYYQQGPQMGYPPQGMQGGYGQPQGQGQSSAMESWRDDGLRDGKGWSRNERLEGDQIGCGAERIWKEWKGALDKAHGEQEMMLFDTRYFCFELVCLLGWRQQFFVALGRLVRLLLSLSQYETLSFSGIVVD